MPKNKGKGGKNRRRGKNENENQKRELVYKEYGQEYAQVIKMLGNARLESYCFDGVKRLCHIRGKLRKKVWINAGDIILVGLRDYQDTKADVILKYNSDEARDLKFYKEIPETARLNEEDNLDDHIEFDMKGIEAEGDGEETAKSYENPISDSDESSEEDSEEEGEDEEQGEEDSDNEKASAKAAYGDFKTGKGKGWKAANRDRRRAAQGADMDGFIEDL